MGIRQLLPPQARPTHAAVPSTAFRSRPFADAGTQHAPPASAAPGFSFADVSVMGPPVQRAAFGFPSARRNATGLPEHIKHGVERLSGVSLDDVSVHYDSPHPRRYKAHAYTQGREIHVSRGQEQHLAHEAWHVVQQKRGRVRPTLQVAGAPVNDDAGLEREAESMGARAVFAGQNALRGAGEPARAAPRPANAGVDPAAAAHAPGAPLQMAKGKAKGKANGSQFVAKVRKQMLAANKKKHKGFHTCTNKSCGFQHKSTTYFKIRNGKVRRAVGDGSFHIDHIKHFSKGGKGAVNNGRVLCGTCNTSRGAGNRIRRTGIKKYAGLHQGAGVHTMTEAQYNVAKPLYKKSKGKVALV